MGYKNSNRRITSFHESTTFTIARGLSFISQDLYCHPYQEFHLHVFWAFVAHMLASKNKCFGVQDQLELLVRYVGALDRCEILKGPNWSSARKSHVFEGTKFRKSDFTERSKATLPGHPHKFASHYDTLIVVVFLLIFFSKMTYQSTSVVDPPRRLIGLTEAQADNYSIDIAVPVRTDKNFLIAR